jgi:fibronectin-binding autotransporter adhesin
VNSIHTRRLLGSLSLLVFAAAFSVAATTVWTGNGANSKWGLAGNWTNGSPSANRNLQFDGSNTVNLNNLNNLAIRSITFNSGASAFTLQGAGVSLGSGGLTNSSSVTQTVNFLLSPLSLSTAQHWNAASAALIVNSAVNNGGNLLTVTGANDTSISGVISNSGGITKNGAGALTLGGVNTYSGDTTIKNGTVRISDDANLGTGDIALSGGTLQTTAAIASGKTISVSGNNNAVDTNGFDSTLSDAITGGGRFVKSGNGVLTLAGVNTYLGRTSIDGGTLSISEDANLGNAASSLRFNTGTLLTTAGITSARNIRLTTGGGTIDTNGHDSTLSGVIRGAGGLTKLNSGTLTLAGINTYRGDTVVNGGTLQAASAVAFSSHSAVVLANAAGVTLDLNSIDQTIGSLAGGGPLGGDVALGSATLTTGVNNTSTQFDGTINGSGALVKTGTGTFTLTGVNTYAGGTTITGGGAIQVSGDQNLGDVSGPLSFDSGTLNASTIDSSRDLTLNAGGGTLDLNSTKPNVVESCQLPQPPAGCTWVVHHPGCILTPDCSVISNATIPTAHPSVSVTILADAMYSGDITGAGHLDLINNTRSGGSFLLSGASNTYSGGTSIGVVNVYAGAANVFGTGAVTLDSSYVKFNGYDQTIGSLSGDQSSQVVIDGAMLTTGSENTDTTFAGFIWDNQNGGKLVKEGTGIFTLASVNNYRGGTTVNGGTLKAGVQNALGFGRITLNNSTTLDLNDHDQIIASLADDASGTRVLLGSATLATGRDNTDTTYSGIISGSGAVIKQGTGTFTLAGANTYLGGTAINGGTFDSNGFDSTLAGDIDGTAGFTKTGAGILTLSSLNNTYSGGTIVNGGTLQAGAQNAFGSGRVTLAHSSTLDLNTFDQTICSLADAASGTRVTLGSATLRTGSDNTSSTYAGIISGIGSVVKEGSGTFTLSGANTYFGGTAINGGTLAISNDNNLGNAIGRLIRLCEHLGGSR